MFWAKSREKTNGLNLREQSGILLPLVLSFWPKRLHKLTKIYFPPAFPRPLRDHDIHLRMPVIDSCLLNVCSSVVWPCRVAEWCFTFANILTIFAATYYVSITLPIKIQLELSSLSASERASYLANSSLVFVYLFFLLKIPPLCKCRSSRPIISTEWSALPIAVLASLQLQKMHKDRMRKNKNTSSIWHSNSIY